MIRIKRKLNSAEPNVPATGSKKTTTIWATIMIYRILITARIDLDIITTTNRASISGTQLNVTHIYSTFLTVVGL